MRLGGIHAFTVRVVHVITDIYFLLSLVSSQKARTDYRCVFHAL